jgi:hypothetical protein
VKTWDIIPFLLLMLMSLALSAGTASLLWSLRRRRGERNAASGSPEPPLPDESVLPVRRPHCWLAIRNHRLPAIQAALGLHNPRPCTWEEGLSDDARLFISPPVKGWTLVVGSGLPDPTEDVDVCYRFLLDLSRKVGVVHYFSVSRILLDHTWVQVDHGRVIRAYAWSGKSLWNQGKPTPEERELELHCFEYGEIPPHPMLGQPDLISANIDKVPQLAARWSLDPAHIEPGLVASARGIVGELTRRY